MKCLSIVVCDDNVDAADSLTLVLRVAGHTVTTAYTASEALSAIQRVRPHAACLDIGLPDVTGYEVAESIRRQEWGRSIMLIAITGYTQESDKLRAHAAGFDYHFAKPVDPVLLERVLSSACYDSQ